MERIVYVIAGPTCSGKTTFAINLAKNINGEVISADSRQFYKYLSIGTAKPTPEELREVKHHFVDFLEPDIDYNVSRFEEEALNKINEMFAMGITPVVAGGSGLYIRAVVDGLFNEVNRDDEYREYLLGLRSKFGNEHIYGILKDADPVSAQRMLPQNWKRVMRALEVYHISGEPIWKLQLEHKRKTDITFKQFGLLWDREILYENINRRVEGMIKEGLLNEVEFLLNKGYSKYINALNTVGYKEIIAYLEGEYTLDRAVELIKRNTRHYAKRQMTWFRKDERIKWIEIKEKNDLFSLAVKELS